METIYVTDCELYDSESFVKKLSAEKFHLSNPVIAREFHGKPYFENVSNLHFSVTHTQGKLFVVFSNKKIGLDAEKLDRVVNFKPLLKRIHPSFRINTSSEFLRLFTAKESVVKWLGGTLAQDCKRIFFTPSFDRVQYCNEKLPVCITHLEFDDFILAVCSEKKTDYSFCTVE